jgi:DNA-binding response OmpR family regulator
MPIESDSDRNGQGPPSHPKTRVLVVDDHPDVAESISRLLRMCGFEVRTALDGRTALAIVAEFRPRFVLLDIGLPDLDGYEVARRLRAKVSRDSVTLIAVTGYGDEEARALSREAGIDSHLVKPVSMEVLLATLARFGSVCH